MAYSVEVQKADEFDELGKHQEALEWLKKASDKGDLEATTRLGKRLLIGDRAPCTPNEGLNFLMTSAKSEGAEALSVLSTLFALGVYVEQSWKSALQSLVVSAQLGWLPAQGQLKALCNNPKIEAQNNTNVDKWSLMANQIDLEGWHRPPQEVTHNEGPLIRSFPDFATKKVCQWLIDKSKTRLQRAQVYDSVSKKVIVHSTRSNSAAVFNLIDTDLVNILVQTKMAACVRIPFKHLEAATVLHYDVGQQIHDHYDFIDPKAPDYQQQISQGGQRIVTFLLYLNDDYEGGETAFPEIGIKHKGKTGEALFFTNTTQDGNADTRSLHAGRPITKGNKWVVSQFIRNRRVF